MLSPYHPLQLAFGLTVWAIWFSAIYGGLSVACAVAPPAVEQGPFTWVNAVLLVVTLVTAVWLLYWARKCWRAGRAAANEEAQPQKLIAYVATGVHLTASVATLGVGASVLFLPPCL